MSIYTGGGDKGYTSLLSGERVPKVDPWVEAYGTLDELGAQLGVCRAMLLKEDRGSELAQMILTVQRGLFRAGMQLSSEQQYWSKLKNPICQKDIDSLEEMIDGIEEASGLPVFFVAPGETLLGSYLHVARTICRRAERRIISAVNGVSGYELLLKYINRLSDLLFSLSWSLETRDLIIKELNDGNHR